MTARSSSHAFNLLLISTAVAGLAVLSYFYVRAWEIGYSSDTALIGLMAKSILERGERPLFVWFVGYQGMLLEGYTAALFFALFGISPVTLNLGPTVFLWLALGVWTWVFARAFGMRVAALALLATVLSMPLFYTLTMRTLPNFPEAMLLGGLIFLVFDLCMDQHQCRQDFGGRKVILLGFLSGFALYTFALTMFYLLALAATLGFCVYRHELRHGCGSFLMAFLRPWSGVPSRVGRKLLQGTSVVAWSGMVVGIVALFATPANFQFQGRVMKWEALQILLVACILIIAPKAVTDLGRIVRDTPSVRRMGVLLTGGFLVGYSPSLYFKLSGGHSIKNVMASGNWPEIAMRFDIYEAFHRELVHFDAVWTWPFAGYFWGCIAFFLSLTFLAARKSMKMSLLPEFVPPPKTMVYAFMIFFGLAIFLISKTVVDMASMRYLIIFVPIYALMLGYGTYAAARRGLGARMMATAGYLGLLVLGADSLHRNLASRPALPYDTIARELAARNLTYAYGDYWLAYATSFLANERVIVEPVYSNYSPHYGPMVKAARRVGYVDFSPGRYRPQNGELTIGQETFRVMEETEIGYSIVLRVLERKE